jgi:hypothetical protein
MCGPVGVAHTGPVLLSSHRHHAAKILALLNEEVLEFMRKK